MAPTRRNAYRLLSADNGKEFTDRFCATGERQPTGTPAFDRVCADGHIAHHPTRPRPHRTNGMIERLNGRIAEVLRIHRFDSAASPGLPNNNHC